MTSLPVRRSASLRRRGGAVVAAALLTAALAACGDEDGAAADDPNTSGASSSSEAAASDALPAWAPRIVTEGDAVTGLDFTGTPEPTDELQVAVVTEGDGPPVEVGQTITANYFGSVYGSDTPFDESFSSEPFSAPIGVGSLIQGWDQEIPGVPVGSRIIMSIPPDQAYGDQDQAGIPGGSTLFFVIDVLDAQ